MGVHGLWKLIEPSGQIVPLETLAGKVLAVDVSIWLHQAVKGMHDAHGAPVAVAHLLILFHRICKLLFYKIKPVFVFDGGVPALKHQTMAARRQRKSVAKNEAMKVREKLIKNLLKHEAVRQMLSSETASAALGLNSFTLPGPSVEEDLYKLPPIAAECIDSESEAEESEEGNEEHIEDIHSIDVTSPEFLSLPPEVRHDILTELIETRKQSSWKHLDSMPKKSDSFSDFQMNRLLKRHAVQTSLEKAGKEMGGRALSLKELESLLGDQGVLDPKTDLPSKRIAQDNVTRYMLVQKENEEKKFDITEHLDEVGWSSESDTDVILERTSKGQIQKSSERREIKNESEKPKIAKEIVDILSVLQDENVEVPEKVKISGSENTCTMESKISIDDGNDTTEIVDNTKENSDESKDGIKLEPETSEEVENKVTTQVENDLVKKDVNSFTCTEKNNKSEDNNEQLSLSFNKSEMESFESEIFERAKNTAGKENLNEKKDNFITISVNNKNEKTNEDKNIYFTLPESGGKPESPAKEEEISSDSENDFIPIDTAEAEKMIQKLPENSQGTERESNPITVVINPSKSDGDDDIFADIFSAKGSAQGGKDCENVEGHGQDTGLKTMVDQLATGDVDDLKKTLELEQEDLMKEKGKQERHSLNPTDQMYTDAQEMLRLFGIPFLVAPMEAEAQCAALNLIGLTEGTITDDSDIWLFGGQVVYKNFFNQNKHVLEYRSENIHKYFKLTREEMIKMALLVGSDYTVGLNGIGPVTALEILAAFQAPNQGLLDALQNFRDWFTGQNKKGPLRAALRRKIKNAVILPGFPNRAVVEAYLNPTVDDSKEPFSWAKPNVDMIRKYVKARLGWSSEKCNELMRPVLKKLEETTTQTTIQRHFKIIQKPPPTETVFSKRIQNAIRRLGSDSQDVEEPEEPEKERKPRKRRKPNNSNDGENIPANTEPSETKTTKKAKLTEPGDGVVAAKRCGEPSKIKIINQKLHQNVTVPQREMTQKMLENRKQEAIKIFRTFKKGRKKTKVYAKEKITLSESSSEDD